MNVLILGRRCIGGAVLVIACLWVSAAWSQAAKGVVDRGKELFEHKFEPNDKLSPKGDGLGPMYNARSCAECHPRGGASSHFVDVVALPANKRRLTEAEADKLLKRAEEVHPAFKNGTSFVLHRFGEGGDYEAWRNLFGRTSGVGGTKKPARISDETSREIMAERAGKIRALSLQVAKRDTPSLLGASLIDKISKESLEQVAAEQRKAWPDVTGRAAHKFGWRGQVPSLADFVRLACANELGLELPDHHQAVHPQLPAMKAKGVDLDEAQVDALITFVASLPPPTEQRPKQLESVLKQGEVRFKNVGCAACHVHTLGGVEGIFSDLLLHDMGSAFDDPLPAPPAKVLVLLGRQEVTTIGGYSGAGSLLMDVTVEKTLETNIRQEWKTPPLWGVRDTAPYMHDGRAATIEKAIAMHGGEAAFAAKRFQLLPADAQSMLVAYVRSLGAPTAGRSAAAVNKFSAD